MKITINIVTASLVAATLATPSAVFAEDTLYIAGNGGSMQNAFEKTIIPAFEAKTGAKVIYVPGNSTDIVAKLVAQKGHQDISLAMADDGPMQTAIDQDLCAPLPSSPVLKDIYPKAAMPGNKAVGLGFYSIGLAYNTDVFKKNGWAAPTSWKDLGDPKFKGKVVVSPIASYGIAALVMEARANGGSEFNVEPGFKFLTESVAPNVVAWEGSPATISQMLQTGEAAITVWGNTRVQPLIDQGAPVAFVYPNEGAERGMIAVCTVNGAPQPKLAQKLLETMLSPEGQTEIARAASFGPTNSKATLDPELAKKVVYGLEQVDALFAPDWSVINKNRPDWTKRWNREVEQQ